ncbi:MAG TPA: FlgD immunoglobulin-like domain containing protein [Bacteroidales bacterium]|nr:FlgD immunoglobulin-like domain containing protein [Bacteroidales bacterium]
MIKKYIVFIIILFITNNLLSQVVNVNPDPNGEPWLAGQLRPLTADDWAFLDQLPRLTTPPEMIGRGLPPMVDNSQQPYFRPIFNQDGGSCGQASGMGYCFTYEIDCERQVPANNLVTQYPTHYTWNFLNGGNGGGSWHFDGWVIVKADGCPNVLDWGGDFAYGGWSRWMSGYDDYYNGMHNRVLDIFAINVGNEHGLETLKNWLFDHMGKREPGGLACFAAGVSNNFTMTTLPYGTPEAGKSVVTWWNSEVNHAMTIVGYNDSVRYDFNGDGQYTNHIDINGDGQVTMKDWEIGALKFANSWGPWFGDGGTAYMMYKGLADATSQGGIWTNTVHVITTRPAYDPFITFKATVKHTSRNKIRFVAGVAADTSATEPDYEFTFPVFYHQGGDLYMQGGSSEADKTLECGLDITPLLGHIVSGEPARFFFSLVEMDFNNAGTGEIVSLSLIDYTNGGEEVASPLQHVPIVEHGTTTISVCKTVTFDAPVIATELLPPATVDEPYSVQMEASGGTPPYVWDILINYEENHIIGIYPAITDEQLIPTDNDDGYVTKELGFSFPYYGEMMDHVTLLTDGSIVFEEAFTYIRDEEKLKTSKAISAYCADLMLYPDQGDGIFYQGSSQAAIFRWKASKFNEPDVNIDVAVVLFPNGFIDFYYADDITGGTGWGAGVSKGDGESFTIACISNAGSIPDNYALEYRPPDYPAEMSITAAGLFSGTPSRDNHSWDITFRITDFLNITATRTLPFSTLHVGIDTPDPIIRDIPVMIRPNPFSSEVSLMFDLVRETQVEMSVYSLSGQLVTTLIRPQVLPAGNHSIQWNGTSDAGTLVNTGIYYYRMNAGDRKSTGKIILLR